MWQSAFGNPRDSHVFFGADRPPSQYSRGAAAARVDRGPFAWFTTLAGQHRAGSASCLGPGSAAGSSGLRRVHSPGSPNPLLRHLVRAFANDQFAFASCPAAYFVTVTFSNSAFGAPAVFSLRASLATATTGFAHPHAGTWTIVTRGSWPNPLVHRSKIAPWLIPFSCPLASTGIDPAPGSLYDTCVSRRPFCKRTCLEDAL